MDKTQIIRSSIAAVLRIPQEDILSTDNLKDDLGADSIDIIEIGLKIFWETDMEASDETMDKWLTVRDIEDWIGGR